MIEFGVYCHPGPPLLVARERSALPCGCFVAVGLRMDTEEAAVGCSPCWRPDHAELLQGFYLALTDSLVNPTTRPLIDVVDELLVATARRWSGAVA